MHCGRLCLTALSSIFHRSRVKDVPSAVYICFPRHTFRLFSFPCFQNTLLVRFDIPPEEDDNKVELPTRNEAILALQRNERARQSRQRATFMKQLR